jgi:hypothetical protein
MRDDSYNGYHIPKNSTVMANIWYVTWLTLFVQIANYLRQGNDQQSRNIP